jgi:hypothetical protein
MQLAPLAYERFLTKGRGAISIDVSDIAIEHLQSPAAKVDLKAKYVVLNDPLIQNEEINEMISSYDPERQLVILFHERLSETLGGVATYVGAPSGLPSPRGLYETYKTKMN